MTEEKFVMELRKQLAEELKKTCTIIEPQKEDEFTAAWYGEVVANCAVNSAKLQLEKMVKDGTVTVRRNAKIVWTIGTPNGCHGSVYTMVKKGKKK